MKPRFVGPNLLALCECSVEEIYFEEHLSRLVILVNDIFDEAGSVRPDMDIRLKPIRIICELVEEISFRGGLREMGAFVDPSSIGWSHCEIDLATLEAAPPDAARLTFKFCGGARVLSILCRNVRLTRPSE